MRFSIASSLAIAAAVKLDDAPPFFNEPTWNEKMPPAAGFIQLSACQASGHPGVTCSPVDDVLFATGMNGDEDLGETIKMKGDTFKYHQSLAQWSPLEVKTAPKDLPFCTGTNGPVGVNCKRPACDGANGPMDGPASSGCIRDEPAKIPHYNEDPTAGRPYGTTGDQTRSDYVPSPAVYDQVPVQGSATFAQTWGDNLIPAEPEKVSVLETPHARSHTTFYGENF